MGDKNLKELISPFEVTLNYFLINQVDLLWVNMWKQLCCIEDFLVNTFIEITLNSGKLEAVSISKGTGKDPWNARGKLF